MFGLQEIKTLVITYCPICEDRKVGRRQIGYEGWTVMCDQCRLCAGFFNFELKFRPYGGSSYSEEEFERYLKLRSFE